MATPVFAWMRKTFRPAGGIIPVIAIAVFAGDAARGGEARLDPDAAWETRADGVGSIPCEAIRAFKARCRSDGTVKVKLVLRTRDYDGWIVAFGIDRGYFEAKVQGRKAVLEECCYHDRTLVMLLDPNGCTPTIELNCPPSL